MSTSPTTSAAMISRSKGRSCCRHPSVRVWRCHVDCVFLVRVQISRPTEDSQDRPAHLKPRRVWRCHVDCVFLVRVQISRPTEDSQDRPAHLKPQFDKLRKKGLSGFLRTRILLIVDLPDHQRCDDLSQQGFHQSCLDDGSSYRVDVVSARHGPWPRHQPALLSNDGRRHYGREQARPRFDLHDPAAENRLETFSLTLGGPFRPQEPPSLTLNRHRLT